MVQSEEQQNVELIALSNQILDLTKRIHELTLEHARAAAVGPLSLPSERMSPGRTRDRSRRGCGQPPIEEGIMSITPDPATRLLDLPSNRIRAGSAQETNEIDTDGRPHEEATAETFLSTARGRVRTGPREDGLRRAGSRERPGEPSPS